MTGVNQKTTLVAFVAIAAVLAVSTIAIGHGRTAFAAETTTISKSTTLELTYKQIQINLKLVKLLVEPLESLALV